MLRFGVVSLLVVATLGAGLGIFLASHVRERAVIGAEGLAAALAATALQPELVASDFAGDRITLQRADELRRRLAPVMEKGDIVHVNVFDSDGRVVWADRSERIGSRSHPSAILTSALNGTAASESTTLSDGSEALEVYVPLEVEGSPRPVGAFELYLPYAPVAEAVRRETTLLLVVLAASLLLVWLLLAGVVHSATRALRRSLEDNAELARTDALTGLPNRLAFEQALQLASRDERSPFSVLLVDLDRFKDVNDGFGHKVGDEALRLVASRLAAAVRPADVVARLASDEFALLLRGSDGEVAAGRVHEALVGLILPIGGSRVVLRASFGVASSDGGGHPDVLLQQADAAMYAAKRGGGGLTRWNPSMAERTAERLELVADMRDAIRTGQLRLLMQPSRRLADGRTVGAEALVRWQHPQRGLLTPDQFVPLAEQSDLIDDLTAWVLDEAVRQCASWVAAGADLWVAVNLSARNLVPELPGQVAAVLARHGLDPRRLCLELTETSLPRSMEIAADVLTEVSALGVTVAVDDFGTGFATLSWLRQLSFNALKIDRSFVAEVASEPGVRELVRHVIALGRGLGMDVVGEGVETDEQAQILAELGCDMAQGYHFARPMPSGDLLGWVRRQEALDVLVDVCAPVL